MRAAHRARLVIDRRLNSPPSIWISAIELMPTLIPTVGTRQRFPCRSGDGIDLIVGVVEPALEEHAAGADDLRIFGDERTLLGSRGPRARCGHERSDDETTCVHE